MVEILKKIFESNPESSTIQLNDICSDCKRQVAIEITATSGGFGLNGGALFKNGLGSYSAQCPDCYKNYPQNR